MKNINNIIVCNTPFQVITALNIWNSFFKEEKTDLVISDCFNNYEKVYYNLKKMKIFHNVYCVETRKKLNNGKQNIINSLLDIKKVISEFNMLENYQYDKLLFYNYDLFTSCLFQLIYEKNDKVISQRYEEGYSTYFNNLDQQKSCKIFERIVDKKMNHSLSKDTSRFWYYWPELAEYKHGNKDILNRIPLLDKSNYEFVDLLNYVFEYNLNEKRNTDVQRQYKCIFFEDIGASKNKNINDTEIVDKIASIVGRENVLVKLHPRSEQNRFESNKIKVFESASVPWELVQLNKNFDDFIFMTIASGSVLASKLYFQDKATIIYLYNCVKEKPAYVTDEFEEYLKKIMDKFGKENVYIPNNMEALCKLFRTQKPGGIQK